MPVKSLGPALSTRPFPDVPASPMLERFVESIGKKYKARGRGKLGSLQTLAGEFRRRFRIGTRVRVQIYKLAKDLGVEIVNVASHPKAGLYGRSTYNPDLSRYEVHIPPLMKQDEGVTVLHEIFELLFWRCHHRIEWWEDWIRIQRIHDPHLVADQFALKVILSSHRVRKYVKEQGLNPWSMADSFELWPGICTLGIIQYIGFPCPFLQVFLDMRDSSVQQPLLDFNGTGKFATIKQIHMKSRDLISNYQCQEMNELEQIFKKRADTIEIPCGDFISEVRESGMARGAYQEKVLGVSLKSPVYVMARPRKNQIILQYVPINSESILNPAALKSSHN